MSLRKLAKWCPKCTDHAVRQLTTRYQPTPNGERLMPRGRKRIGWFLDGIKDYSDEPVEIYWCPFCGKKLPQDTENT